MVTQTQRKEFSSLFNVKALRFCLVIGKFIVALSKKSRVHDGKKICSFVCEILRVTR